MIEKVPIEGTLNSLLSDEGRDKLQVTLALNKLERGESVVPMNLTLRQEEILENELMRKEWRERRRKKFFKST